MTDKQVLSAVQNNAHWCDLVCRSHGKPGEFLPEIWLNRQETPPFYPNAVTLTPGQAAPQKSHIKELLKEAIPGEWGVKDSFCSLDLAPLGFEEVFEGAWLYQEDFLTPAADQPVAEVRWCRIDTEAELAGWEQAWAGEPAEELATAQMRVFLPSLLTNDDVAIIAGLVDGKVVAGAIVSRTGEVAGISNLFLPSSDALAFRTGCVAHARTLFPRLPLVGYEGSPDLEEMLALGFVAVGPVRIWVRVDTQQQ